MNKYFFSVIISTYNPLQWIKQLIISITHNDCINEIQIIISDDQSSEPLNEILTWYEDLNIEIITNDQHYGAPRWGRENGMNHAKGTWITFADQDDYFLDNTFDKIKNFIENKNINNYIISDIYYEYPHKGNQRIPVKYETHLTHGKFYERTFLIEQNLHYDEIMTGEDTNFQLKVQSALFDNQLPIHYFQDFTYVWVQRTDSLSKKGNYNSIEFFHGYFLDYVRGTLVFYIEQYKYKIKKHIQMDATWYENQIAWFFIFAYCYLTAMENHHNHSKPVPKVYYQTLKQYFNEYLILFNTTTEEYLEKIHHEYFDAFCAIYANCSQQFPFIPLYTYMEWVNHYLN